jgi:pimeloyl-ACP methyl ester carboxylesterase
MPDAAARRAVISSRREDPLYEQVSAAFERIQADGGSDADWDALAPFGYGRWDAAAQAHSAAGPEQTNEAAGDMFIAGGAFDPEATTAALASFTAPVLLLSGELDMVLGPATAVRYAAVFPAARLVIQPSAGHYPWLDDPPLLPPR